MSNAQALQISYVPSCSQQAQFNQYNAADAAGYTPDRAGYYRHQVPVMLPGAIIGAVCLLAAVAFLAWVSRQTEPSGVRCTVPQYCTIQRILQRWCPFAAVSPLLQTQDVVAAAIHQDGVSEHKRKGQVCAAGRHANIFSRAYDGLLIQQVLYISQEDRQRQADHELHNFVAHPGCNGCWHLGTDRQHQRHKPPS